MRENRSRIALVQDAPVIGAPYDRALLENGYDVALLSSGRAALEHLENRRPDLMLLHLRLPDMEGLEILRIMKKRRIRIPVIAITDRHSIGEAMEALRQGARDFLIKPFEKERLQSAVVNELGSGKPYTMPAILAGQFFEEEGPPVKKADRKERTTKDCPMNLGAFIGSSPQMQKVYRQIEAAARSRATVFITGESGTGKEICAETIHKNSARADKPFVPINCAAIPRDLMESELFGHVKGAFTGAIADRDGAARLSDGGTLFLDEIAEMTPDMQSKLLRFLQGLSFQKVGGSRIEKTDVRIICATNRNPADEIKAGRFREDLFYRLHVLPIDMPPLRERETDILDIALSSLRLYAAEEGKSFRAFTPETRRLFLAYDWPGNIRQLQNIIRNIVVMHDAARVEPFMLPAEIFENDSDSHSSGVTAAKGGDGASPGFLRPLATIEREIIEEAIALCGGNIPKAAAALHVAPSTIYRKKASWKSG